MSIKGRIHSVETFGTVDGPGIRYIIFFQGCPLRCQYCHNRDSWDKNSGKEALVEDLVTDIKKYIPFMKTSGGGVTFSGGEPTLQLPFLIALAKELKGLGLHLALDTSGYVPFSEAEELLQYIDLVLLDLKEVNPQKHKDLTGVENTRILEFAMELSHHGIPLWIRHVVVPGITDAPEDVEALAQFILSLNTVQRVELLPYHSMGKFKWNKLQVKYPLDHIKDATDSDLKKVSNILCAYHINIKCSVVA